MRTLISLAVLLAVAVAPATAAAAKKNPYTAKGVCGAGYKEIDRHKLYDTGPDGIRYRLADMVLFYNASNGYNCAVTMKKRRINKPDYLWISLETHGAGDGDGRTNLKFFAGPAYVYARDKCIVWHGGAELKFRYHNVWWNLYDAWRSRWSHCD